MCMATAYKHEDGNDTLLCEDVMEVRVNDNQVTLVDVMGQAVTIAGAITKVDLVRSIMLIEPAV